ncbi:FAD-dependent oxidoreductase [Streptosporangium sp. NBC_01756]|uniref:FAD-dependent oxidoreductase n=1 Tax=Streptosporangium sp. NBC_01756 TaxID=2975950 RepID=UPI002DDC693A|nr:NAD(P)/FAD-dependent oxidoreductase [Streptosporangium sp. NBC_01756]WSC85759.1 FAD-dependent monooxygenase [Streptosporangium sp. NBC_01756]
MRRVIVAGAGPVGLTAALVLARRGAEVVVLEAGEGLATESRASTFHPPTLEMLAELEVLDPLMRRGVIASTFQYRDRTEGLVAELDLAVLAADTPYPFRVQCEQSKLTPILLAALDGRAEVRFGHAVRDVVLTGDGVTVTTGPGGARNGTRSGTSREPQDGTRSGTSREPQGGTEDGTSAGTRDQGRGDIPGGDIPGAERIGGDWLIGADGAHSAVRLALGVPFDGITYPERFLVASVEEDLDRLIPGIGPINYVSDPVEWLVLLRTPDHWRVLLPTPAGTSDHAELARLPARLRTVADPGRPWKVAHASLYPVHQRVAASFRRGPVLLAGDAAHVNNPLGGMGMNSGIHDAVVLGTALADVIAGAPGRVLDDAAARRRTVALDHVQRASHANWERIRSGADHRAGLRALAADPEAARAHLLRSSMIASLRPDG